MMKRESIAQALFFAPDRVSAVDQQARLKTRLQEEIEFLQTRLEQIGPDGDCGYENALIRFFNQQIDLRRNQLAGHRRSGR